MNKLIFRKGSEWNPVSLDLCLDNGSQFLSFLSIAHRRQTSRYRDRLKQRKGAKGTVQMEGMVAIVGFNCQSAPPSCCGENKTLCASRNKTSAVLQAPENSHTDGGNEREGYLFHKKSMIQKKKKKKKPGNGNGKVQQPFWKADWIMTNLSLCRITTVFSCSLPSISLNPTVPIDDFFFFFAFHTSCLHIHTDILPIQKC